MANLQGYEVDVPLLMIFWYAESSSPSNVIILDSTVAFPIDIDDKDRWDAYRFDIRNAKTVSTNTTVNRTFCAPKKARDAWIYAISNALLVYSKANDKARKAALVKNEARRIVPQMVRPKSPPYDDVWSSENCVAPNKRFTAKKGLSSPPRLSTPPTSPMSRSPKSRTTKRAVPRSSSPHLPKPSIDKS